MFPVRGHFHSSVNNIIKAQGHFGRSLVIPSFFKNEFYLYSELSGGMNGYYHEATAGRSTMYADKGFWHGKITGTDAVIYARDYDGMLNVSVDGGAWHDATNASGLHTLFSGLTDEEHDVTIRMDAIFGSSNGWLDTSQEYSLNVTGTSPSVSVLSHSAMAFDDTKLLTSGEKRNAVKC